MGKSILILDTPECCGECPFMDGGCIDEYCSAHGEDCIDIPDIMGGKPEWCPLRPLPDHIEVCGKYPQPGPVPSYRIGWNACLDKITEDLEEESN